VCELNTDLHGKDTIQICIGTTEPKHDNCRAFTAAPEHQIR
jgi:hypothetical protein